MDATTEKLVDYAMNVQYDSLSASTVEACKLRILDTLGCVAGGYDHPVSVAARTLAARYSMDQPATMLGSRARVAPEMAAFANGVMLRVLDLSDMYRVKSGGHPSDIIAAALAAAELGDCDGRSIITAIHGQSAVWTALEIRERFQIEDVATVRIYTYRTAFNLMANDPSRWAPATRETADHSLPFVVSAALLDGAAAGGANAT